MDSSAVPVDPTSSIVANNIPDGVYYALGFLILTNLGTIVTVIGAAFRMVYKFAILESTTKALHKRVDRIENLKYNDEGDDNGSV